MESHGQSNGRVCRGQRQAFQPGEDEQIIAYLSATQTPDAVNQRKAQVAAASSAGRSMVSAKAAAAPDQTAPPRRYERRTIGFVSFVFLSMLALVMRRPARVPLARASASTRRELLPAAISSPRGPADPEAGEHHTADLGRKDPAFRCSRWPEA